MQSNDTYPIPVNDRGGLTLPKKLREKAGVEQEQYMVAELTDQGILLRPAAFVPYEVWSEDRLAEFRSHEEKLGRLLDEYGIKKTNDFSR